MSTIRNTAWTLAASVALGTGTMAAGFGATEAHAASACSIGTKSVYCSMEYAKRINYNLVSGSHGEHVKNLQRALRQLRYPVRVTGVYDGQTRTQVKKYQASRKIRVTGNVGPATRHALRVGAGNKATVRRVTSSVQLASSNSAQAAVDFAYAQLGKPYIYGATGPGGYDCSGLTSAAWRAAGVSIPRTSGAQWSALQRVSQSSLRAGDIVVFYGGGHVGIYVGNGYVIHAPRPGKSVEKVRMSSMPFTAAVRPA